MMSNLRPGTETVSHLVSGDNEEQRGQILAVCLRGAIPRLVLNSPSESVARMIEFIQLVIISALLYSCRPSSPASAPSRRHSSNCNSTIRAIIDIYMALHCLSGFMSKNSRSEIKRKLSAQGSSPNQFEGMLGVSLPMLEVFQRIIDAASADIPVLITGETGTGKDLVAGAIHNRSKRKDKPFVAVNTGAMATELIASELFGHEKGAYTGASGARKGSFELADGGTIFLDEISTMDEKCQVFLLRVLETKTFRRVGGEKDIRVDVRVIGATNENLETAVKKKQFREDLYFRFDVFRINLPPLRDRPGGLQVLSQNFLEQFNQMYNKQLRSVSAEALRYLESYSWPGNVRELKNVIQRAVLVAKGSELTPDLLPARIKDVGESDRNSFLASLPIHVGMTLEAAEREFLAMTLGSVAGNKTRAASILGISRRTLYDKLKRYRLA